MQNNGLSEREKIAGRLKEARTLAGLSQAQVADKMALQRPAITEIEAGKRKVSAEEIIQFAKLYNVDTSWLLLREQANESYMDQQMKVAARELGKMKPEDVKKLLHVLKILPK